MSLSLFKRFVKQAALTWQEMDTNWVRIENALNALVGRVDVLENGAIDEAPDDGKLYGRQNGVWVELENGAIDEAPNDGKIYGRQNGVWVEIECCNEDSGALLTEDGEPITTENGEPILPETGENSNEDNDGLLTEDGEPIMTEDDEPILPETGENSNEDNGALLTEDGEPIMTEDDDIDGGNGHVNSMPIVTENTDLKTKFP